MFFFAWYLCGLSRETGLEPATSDVTGRCSNQLNYSRKVYGRNRTRTYDHLCVRQELYQLSYTPKKTCYIIRTMSNFSQEDYKEQVKSFRYQIFIEMDRQTAHRDLQRNYWLYLKEQNHFAS